MKACHSRVSGTVKPVSRIALHPRDACYHPAATRLAEAWTYWSLPAVAPTVQPLLRRLWHVTPCAETSFAEFRLEQ